MAKTHSILFVSSEIYPFAKESGIGDFTYSFSLAIRDLGHDIRIMVPKYGSVSERKNRIHEINRLRDIPIPMGSGHEPATVKSSSVNNPRSKVQAYITTNFNYFDSKKGIYRDPRTGKEYSDNPERFIFFSRSVVETCMLLGWYPDIIHCNGWQTAIIPAYIKAAFPSKFKKTKSVFTVHNFQDNVICPEKVFNKAGLPDKAMKKFLDDGKYNFIKGGIEFADYVTTLSPAYAEEVYSDEAASGGLDGFLKNNSKKFAGIRCGIDTWGWNPVKDKIIPGNYDSDFDEYKYTNKVELCNKFGIEYHPKIMIIGMAASLSDDNGIDLLLEAAPEILKDENIKIVFLGKGDPELKKQMTKTAKKFPDQFKIKYATDDELAHLIFAGSDAYAMPSKYEGGGLDLMYALTYGTIPIVRNTGAIKEIAENINESNNEGNAFVFEEYRAEEFAEAVNKAVKLFSDKDAWEEVARTGMSGDYSWQKWALRYEEIYKSITK
ncbi:MAG: glycogen synthase [Bacteroidota bacterium]